MARRLTAKRVALVALLVLLVLCTHFGAIEWLASFAVKPLQFKPMPKPLFTREVQLSAPPKPVTPPPPVLDKKPSLAGVEYARAATKNVAKSSPEPTPTLPELSTPTSTATASASSSTATSVTAAGSGPEGSDTFAWQNTWPVDIKIFYKLGGYYRGDLHGNASVQWQLAGEQYQIEVQANLGPINAFTMTSQGVITPRGLSPALYEEVVMGRRRNAQLRERDILISQGRVVPRPEGVQDTASQFVEVFYRFMRGISEPRVGEVVRYPLARPGGVDEWVYDVVEEDTIYTARWGAIKALHLKPRPLANPRGTIYAEMWFAPSLQYVPVRIKVQVDAETFVDLVIERAEQAEPLKPTVNPTLPAASSTQSLPAPG
jgi:hypothetical protein